MGNAEYMGSQIASFRPEGNNAVFGPCTGCNRYLNSTDINTDLVVIGAAINDATFCGFFWTGFYNQRVSDEPICFTRNSFNEPDAGACGRGFVQNTAGGQQAANYNLINRLLNDIQAAFDALPTTPNPISNTRTTITNTITNTVPTNTVPTNTVPTNTRPTVTNTVYDDNDNQSVGDSSGSVAVLSLALAGFAVLLN